MTTSTERKLLDTIRQLTARVEEQTALIATLQPVHPPMLPMGIREPLREYLGTLQRAPRSSRGLFG
jgi:hypothetical protein